MENSFKTIREGILSGELKQKDRQLAVVPEPWTKDHVVQPAIWTRVNPFVAQFRGPRPLVKDELLFNTDHGRIYFSGEILDTADEEVWLQIVKMSGKKLFQQKEGTFVTLTFNGYEFLKALGRKGNGRDNLEWLWSSLKRLQHGSIELQTKQRRFVGSFLSHVDFLDDSTYEFTVDIDPKFGKSYLNFAYTQINFTERICLKGGMAKKIHSFLSSQRNHTKGYKYTLTIDEARAITGSKASQKKFRYNLKVILDQFLKLGFLRFAHKVDSDTWDLTISNF